MKITVTRERLYNGQYDVEKIEDIHLKGENQLIDKTLIDICYILFKERHESL